VYSVLHTKQRNIKLIYTNKNLIKEINVGLKDLEKNMRLKDLKQGDRLRFMYGYDFVNATVLENFPVQKRIRVVMENGITRIFEYGDSNFDLWNILEPEKTK
jgi:hypothetical protein